MAVLRSVFDSAVRGLSLYSTTLLPAHHLGYSDGVTPSSVDRGVQSREDSLAPLTATIPSSVAEVSRHPLIPALLRTENAHSKGSCSAMKIAATIARYLLAFVFLMFELNGFLHFIPTPPPLGPGGMFMDGLYISHELAVIMALQLLCGILLLAGRFVPLALAVLGPIIVNIVLFHAFMAPAGLPAALFTAVLWFLTYWSVRPAFSRLFQASPTTV